MTPQEEAGQILAQVINDLTATGRDLKVILRRCQHVCELLDWHPQESWFHQEMNGYYAQTPLPVYRKIHGQLVWEPKGSFYNQVQWGSEAMVYGLEPDDVAKEDTLLEVQAGIDWLLNAAQYGYREITGETKHGWLRSSRREILLQRVKVFPAANFATSVAEIEKNTFDFASKAYVQLRYGNTLGDIWIDYRRRVDAALQQLNFFNHLEAIRSGLQSDNPESWRSAVFECRNLLDDVAKFLWRDPRKTYEHLPGDGPNGKLKVTQDRFANRLSAYLHQKGLRGKQGQFLRDEVERLAASIRSLIALQSKAHKPISREDARTIALATYFILGELVIKTDMKPIEAYVEPAKGIDLLEE